MSETNIHKRHNDFLLSSREERLIFENRSSGTGGALKSENGDQPDIQLSQERAELSVQTEPHIESPETRIHTIQKNVEEGALVTIPSVALDNVPERQLLFRTIKESQLLDALIAKQMQNVTASRISDVDKLESGQKEEILLRILESPQQVITSIELVRSERARLERNLEHLERYKDIINIDQLSLMQAALDNLHEREIEAEHGNMSEEEKEKLRQQREDILQQMGVSPEDVEMIAQNIRQNADRAADNIKAFNGWKPQQSDSDEEVVLRLFWDLSDTQRKRGLLGPVSEAQAAERSSVRDRYADALSRQEVTLGNYLRALCLSKIKRLQETLNREREEIEGRLAASDEKGSNSSRTSPELSDRARIFAIESKADNLNEERKILTGEKPGGIDIHVLSAVAANVTAMEAEIGAESDNDQRGRLHTALDRDVVAMRVNESIAEEIAKEVHAVSEKIVWGQPEAAKAIAKLLDIYGDYRRGREHVPMETRMNMQTTNPTILEKDLTAVMIIANDPDFAAKAENARSEADEVIRRDYPNNDTTRKLLLKESDAAIDAIKKSTRMELSHVLQIPDLLDKQKTEINWKLHAAENPEDPEHEEMYRQAVMGAMELKKAQSLLETAAVVEEVATNEEFSTKTSLEHGIAAQTYGYYSFDTKKIYLNMEKIRQDNKDRDAVEAHERNHLLIDILCRQTMVLPGLLVGTQIRLNEAAKKLGTNAEELLRTFARECDINEQATNWKEMAMDEAAVVFADFVSDRKTTLTDAERKIFNALDLRKKSDADKDVLGPVTRRDSTEGEKRERGRRMAADSGEDPEDAGPTEEEYPFRKNWEEINWELDRIDEFMNVYPQNLQAQAVQGKTYAQHITDLKWARDITGKAYTQEGIQNPERNRQLQAALNELKEKTGEVYAAVKDFDEKKMDLTTVPPSTKRTLFQRASERIVWCSVSDMWGILKDAGEDIQRMWKRRGEDVRAKLGHAISKTFIPESIPYFGRLQYDFRGREKNSEQEEVGVWEKRFEHVDNHTLEHMIKGQHDKDKVKAIINLLTKRGRMNFSDTDMWDTLERLSKYSMPHEACKRDLVLRNAYLQKLSTQIWDEKDLFEKWKNANDSAIKSEKSAFTPTVDSLSSIPKGQKHSLARLLEAWDKQKNHSGQISPEEEVNPHQYEEHVHYAMRNGKMDMEDKFFYLIQGVARGLLNIDRLNAFNGEQGGILNEFPFIDFFDRKNNTLHEIKQIAERITNDKNPYVYDYRTTYLLFEEVRNNKAVHDRVTKGIKASQNIDHEDIPLLVGMLDHNNIKQMTDIAGGQLWRLSAPAMKNAYVGYNSLFQYYAIRAKMLLNNTEGVQPFSKEDITKLTTSLVAFIMYDNLMTQVADNGTKRPHLSWNEINNEAPVSGERKTKEYRDTVTGFASGIVKGKLGITSVNHEKQDLTADDIIGLGRDSHSVETMGSDKRKALFTDSFYEKLTKRIHGELTSRFNTRPKELLLWLSEYADTFHPELSEFNYKNISGIAPTWNK